MLEEYRRTTRPDTRARRRATIIQHAKNAVAVTKELRVAAHDVLSVAKELP
jgi:hypothetical protein